MQYLTNKSIQIKVGDWVLIGVCTLLAVSTVSAFIKSYMEKDNEVLAALVLFFFLFIILTVFRIRVVLNRVAAQKIARQLNTVTEDSVKLRELSNATGIRPEDKLSKKIAELINSGYLANIKLDYYGESVMLLIESDASRKVQYTTVSCPSCGAANRVRAGRETTCEYCGAKIAKSEK